MYIYTYIYIYIHKTHSRVPKSRSERLLPSPQRLCWHCMLVGPEKITLQKITNYITLIEQINVHINLHTNKHAHMCIYNYIHIHVYICIYICIHKYI